LKSVRNEEAAQVHANVNSSLFTHYTENNLHFYLTHIYVVNTCANHIQQECSGSLHFAS